MKPTKSAIPRGPKIVVGVTTLVSAGAVFYSHYSQVEEKKIMRAGVERDKERMRMKRRMKKMQAQQAAALEEKE